MFFKEVEMAQISSKAYVWQIVKEATEVLDTDTSYADAKNDVVNKHREVNASMTIS